MTIFSIPVERRALLYLIGDVLLCFISIAWGQWLRFGPGAPGADLLTVLHDTTGASAVFIVTHLLVLYLAEGYDLDRDFRLRINIFRIWVAIVAAFLGQAILFYLLPNWWWGRGITFISNLVFAVLLTVWRLVASAVRPRMDFRRPTLVIGAGKTGQLIAQMIREHPAQGDIHELVGFLDDREVDTGATGPRLGGSKELEEVVRCYRVRSIVVAVLSGMQPHLTAQLLSCKAAGVRIEDMRTVYKRLTGKVPIHYLSDTALIFGPDFSGVHGLGGAVQRVIDVVLALIGLLLTGPVIALGALAVKLDSRGPAFFLQERVGLNEVPFTIIKLRTMRTDAEQATGPVWSQGAGDPRVTKVGRFLRRSRIDELPQFFNILRGDMSLVGPRPEREHFVSRLKEQIPFYGLRFAARPGVTGWAQVKYRYGASEEDAAEKLCYDLFAIQEMSPALYLLVVVKTVQTVLLRPGS